VYYNATKERGRRSEPLGESAVTLGKEVLSKLEAVTPDTHGSSLGNKN
jgi:hypothetical protein